MKTWRNITPRFCCYLCSNFLIDTYAHAAHTPKIAYGRINVASFVSTPCDLSGFTPDGSFLSGLFGVT